MKIKKALTALKSLILPFPRNKVLKETIHELGDLWRETRVVAEYAKRGFSRKRVAAAYESIDEALDDLRKDKKLEKYDFRSPDFYAAIAAMESSFNPKVVSSANAYGLLQVVDGALGDVAKMGSDYDFDKEDLLTDGSDSKKIKNAAMAGILYWHKCQDYAAAMLPDEVGEWEQEDQDKIVTLMYKMGPGTVRNMYKAVGEAESFEEFAKEIAKIWQEKLPGSEIPEGGSEVLMDLYKKIEYVDYFPAARDKKATEKIRVNYKGSKRSLHWSWESFRYVEAIHSFRNLIPAVGGGVGVGAEAEAELASYETDKIDSGYYVGHMAVKLLEKCIDENGDAYFKEGEKKVLIKELVDLIFDFNEEKGNPVFEGVERQKYWDVVYQKGDEIYIPSVAYVVTKTIVLKPVQDDEVEAEIEEAEILNPVQNDEEAEEVLKLYDDFEIKYASEFPCADNAIDTFRYIFGNKDQSVPEGESYATYVDPFTFRIVGEFKKPKISASTEEERKKKVQDFHDESREKLKEQYPDAGYSVEKEVPFVSANQAENYKRVGIGRNVKNASSKIEYESKEYMLIDHVYQEFADAFKQTDTYQHFYDIDPELANYFLELSVFGLAAQESSYNAELVSKDNAQGVFQLINDNSKNCSVCDIVTDDDALRIIGTTDRSEIDPKNVKDAARTMPLHFDRTWDWLKQKEVDSDEPHLGEDHDFFTKFDPKAQIYFLIQAYNSGKGRAVQILKWYSENIKDEDIPDYYKKEDGTYNAEIFFFITGKFFEACLKGEEGTSSRYKKDSKQYLAKVLGQHSLMMEHFEVVDGEVKMVVLKPSSTIVPEGRPVQNDEGEEGEDGASEEEVEEEAEEGETEAVEEAEGDEVIGLDGLESEVKRVEYHKRDNGSYAKKRLRMYDIERNKDDRVGKYFKAYEFGLIDPDDVSTLRRHFSDFDERTFLVRERESNGKTIEYRAYKEVAIHEDLVPFMDEYRENLGFPIVVDEGYRPGDYNARVAGNNNTPHPLGTAIDINLNATFNVLRRGVEDGSITDQDLKDLTSKRKMRDYMEKEARRMLKARTRAKREENGDRKRYGGLGIGSSTIHVDVKTRDPHSSNRHSYYGEWTY